MCNPTVGIANCNLYNIELILIPIISSSDVHLNDQLILLALAVLDGDAGVHPHLPDELLTEEVAHLHTQLSSH